jgi:hypothetical protein
MSILRALFRRRRRSEHDAREMIRQVRKFLDENGPMMTVQFMASEEFKRMERQYWPKELIGHEGPLHSEFVSLLNEIKARGDSIYKAARSPK